MTRRLGSIFSILLLAISYFSSARAKPAFDAYDLINGVNQLRSQHGLPAYQINNILMSIAQSQSEWQASIGKVSHEGPGGTRPRDRAIAAGYGGGSTIFISENIAGGNGLTAAEAITMWQGDDPHLNTMLGANYRDVGAGVAIADGFVYFTLDAGYSTGSSGNNPLPTNPPGSPPPYQNPVQTSTPFGDGSVYHIVQLGETLWDIALAYGVLVDYIKQLNGLTSDTVYEKQKLLIRLPQTPTPTQPVTPTKVTKTPQPTKKPSSTPPPTRTATKASSPTLVPTETLESGKSIGNFLSTDPLLTAIIALGVVGLLLIILGTVLRRRV